jgi:hypothetical protein
MQKWHFYCLKLANIGRNMAFTKIKGKRKIIGIYEWKRKSKV